MHSNVRIVRLVTGEDVLANIRFTDDKVVELEDPYAIYFREIQGKLSVALGPWVPYRKNKSVIVNKAAVVFIDEADEGLVKRYLENISGIALPDGKISTL